jgi:hypothetical protein
VKHAAHASGRRGGQRVSLAGRLRHKRAGAVREADVGRSREVEPGRADEEEVEPGRADQEEVEPGRAEEDEPDRPSVIETSEPRDDEASLPREEAAGPGGGSAGVGRAGGERFRRYTPLSYWVVLAVVGLGLLLLRASDGQALRGGTFVIAGALLAGSVLRLALPEGRAGMLGSRRRLADTAVMTVLGISLLIAGLTMSASG